MVISDQNATDVDPDHLPSIFPFGFSPELYLKTGLTFSTLTTLVHIISGLINSNIEGKIKIGSYMLL